MIKQTLRELVDYGLYGIHIIIPDDGKSITDRIGLFKLEGDTFTFRRDNHIRKLTQLELMTSLPILHDLSEIKYEDALELMKVISATSSLTRLELDNSDPNILVVTTYNAHGYFNRYMMVTSRIDHSLTIASANNTIIYSINKALAMLKSKGYDIDNLIGRSRAISSKQLRKVINDEFKAVRKGRKTLRHDDQGRYRAEHSCCCGEQA